MTSSDFVHQAFKSAGYITDTRPLKLHCTILNASHRKPRVPRYGFSFADMLKAEEVMALVGGEFAFEARRVEGIKVDGEAASDEFEIVPHASRTGFKGGTAAG
jgi:activating signal cointegrator complex subunit 1